DWLIGWGCATACYPTHVGTATARVRLLPTGEVRVQTAAHEIGTGAYTVIGQMAAERLGVPLGSVKVELGDSTLPPAPVAGGSNTTASACSAVLKACDAIRARLARSPATADQGRPAGFAADYGPEMRADLFRRLGVGAIEEYAEFIPRGGKPDAVSQLYAGQVAMTGGPSGEKLMYAVGAVF